MGIFAVKRPIVGMVHLLPLPGSPRARVLRDVKAAALADARTLAKGGVDGILVENYGDVPFGAGPVEPHVGAMMAVIARELGEETKLPIGLNVLRNDARAALAAAEASGAVFIRVNVHVGAAETDQGRIEGRAHETLRYRKALASRVHIFADVLVKHARPVGAADPAQAARETAVRGLADVLLVTGAETGAAPDPGRVREVKRAVPDRPVFVASGVTEESLSRYPESDGYIIGSALERGGVAGNRVELRRVQALIRARNGR